MAVEIVVRVFSQRYIFMPVDHKQAEALPVSVFLPSREHLTKNNQQNWKNESKFVVLLQLRNF